MIPYLQAEHISKRFADYMLLNDISFTIFKDQKVALIAKNGAGKSTLMDILSGKESADTGNITLTNDIKIGYLKQIPDMNPEMTVLEMALSSDNPVLQVISDFESAIRHNEQQLITDLSIKMEEMHAWNYDIKVKQILSQLKIDNFDQKVKELSGGQQKRLALANVLANEPDLLLLDEPTNHLDLEMIEWLETYLKRSKCTLFMVTHDRYFLDRVCDEIIEIDQDKIYSYSGNYSYYLGKRKERIEQEQAAADKAKNLLRTEQEWMRRMPQARAHKAKYRIANFYDLKDKADSGRQEDKLELNFASSRLGKKILNISHLSKSYGDLHLIKDLSYKFAPREKIGIIGKNGCGKSTLLNIITKKIIADSGEVDMGQTIRIGYYRQEGITFKEDEKIIDVIKNISEVINFDNGTQMTASQLLTHFLFPPETQYSPVEKLSGGERRRLYLCTILMNNPNFLILDEPTNDLDIMTLAVFEDYLINFDGCVIVVSHDRFFMDEIVDHLFAFEGDGKIKDYPGNYSQYRESHPPVEKKENKKEPVSAENKSASTDNRRKYRKVEKKISYKEKKELEKLEKEIAELEKEKKGLQTEMNSGNLDNDKLVEKSKRFGEINSSLENKETRWLELSEKAE